MHAKICKGGLLGGERCILVSMYMSRGSRVGMHLLCSHLFIPFFFTCQYLWSYACRDM